jgi:hypothetical protein
MSTARLLLLVALALGMIESSPVGVASFTQREPSAGASTTEVGKVSIAYLDAHKIFDALRENLLPADFRSKTPPQREGAWSSWAARHDAAIRRRLDQGDDDSIINLLLFGVTFTQQPRTDIREMLRAGAHQRHGRRDYLSGRPAGGPRAFAVCAKHS